MAGEAPEAATAAPASAPVPTSLPGRHFTSLEDPTAVLVELPEQDGQPNIQAIKREVRPHLLQAETARIPTSSSTDGLKWVCRWRCCHRG